MFKECQKQDGVPHFISKEFSKKTKEYCLLIPVINEGERIHLELKRAMENNVDLLVDIVICDGDSNDGSTKESIMKLYNVNSLLVKKDEGKQGSQLRMGIWWALERGYRGIITIDGNNKDSIEDVYKFVDKLNNGYDFIQGSRFIDGGKGVNTPLIRDLAVRLIHAPIISLTANEKFTDTTNNYRAYSKRYLVDDRVKPFRDIFKGYELLAYLSTRASQLGYKTTEVPVFRIYPKNQKVPTKISFFIGNLDLIKILLNNLLGKYIPK